MNEHFHILNPSFSYEVKSESLHNLYPFWLLRDGLLPLIRFFHKPRTHSSTYRGRLLLHKALQFAIPKKHPYQIGLYEIIPHHPSNEKRNKVLIFGVLNRASFSLQHLNSRLHDLRDVLLEKKIPHHNVYITLPLRENPWFEENKDSSLHLAKYIQCFFETLGHQIHFIPLKEVLSAKDLSSFYSLSLHQKKILVSDSALEHLVLEKRALPIEFSSVGHEREAINIPISPHHSYRIENFSNPSFERSDEIQEMLLYLLKDKAKHQTHGQWDPLVYKNLFLYLQDLLERL